MVGGQQAKLGGPNIGQRWITFLRDTSPFGTYKMYSLGCLVVWAVLLLLAVTRGNDTHFKDLLLVCMGWGIGWLSATIARSVYKR